MARYSVDYDGDLSTTDDRVSYGSFNDAVGSINSQGFDSYSIQDNRRGGGGGLGSFGSDRSGREAGFAALNEARPVRSGLGGLLGGIFGGQRQGGGLFGYTGLRDMVDGAGPGASGPQFRGGLYSGLLNTIGVSPLGQGRRGLSSAQPAQRPMRPAPAGGSPQDERSFTPQQQSGGSTTTLPSAASRPLTAQDIMRLQSVGMAQNAMIGEAATPEEQQFLNARMGQSAVPSATNRYMSNYGMTPAMMGTMALPAPQAPPPNPALLPRATPDIGELRNYLSGQPSAMSSMTQPGMNVMNDGETFLRQNIAAVPVIDTPYVTTPQTDPRVDGRYTAIRRPTPQIEGFRPFRTQTTPAPAPNAMNIAAADRYLPPDPFRANQLRAYRDVQARMAAGLLGR